MSSLPLSRRSRSSALWLAVACFAAVAAALAGFACTARSSDIHETDQAKGKPCANCHTGAFTAAVNPQHVGQFPQTCQDCHVTKAWTPWTKNHDEFWPIRNKHITNKLGDVKCAQCHTKGYKPGDTPKDCVGCHRKDFDTAINPKVLDGQKQHFAKGVDQYPLDCLHCHTDMGWDDKPWQHESDVFKLEESHLIAPCAGCHTGNPPQYKGTASTNCFVCHQKDADGRALAKNPNHASYPHTCLDCHLYSGWAQGPPLGGLHPEAKFPITTGKHAGQVCQNCHVLAKGLAAGGANTDCVNCHDSTGDHHRIPAIDAYHQKTPDGGTVGAYPVGSATTNFCLQCHTSGQHL